MCFSCRNAAASQHHIAITRSSSRVSPHSPFTDRIHVQTHRRDLAAAVLVEFVATRLTPEAVKEELVAEITVGQFEEGLPYLHDGRGKSKNAYKNLTRNVGAAVLTKLCIVRGMSSRTSTSSSSPTRGVISVSQSVNLFRLQTRQKGENVIQINNHVLSPGNNCLKVHDAILRDATSADDSRHF